MRLLQKTIRSYLLYSAGILLVAIPVLYEVIKGIVKEDTDEHLQATKAAVQQKIMGGAFEGLNSQDIVLKLSDHLHPSDRFVNRSVYDSISQEEVPYRVLISNFVVKGQAYHLEVRNSMVDGEDLIESIVKIVAFMLLLLLGGMLLINRSLTKRLWRPFYRTLDTLRHYSVEQQRALDLPPSRINEFNDLNGTLQELTDRVREAYRIQKEFTENASHEIQTPLAILQSKLELLMQTSPLNDEQAELISDLANANQRLARLNKSLILLTRIENQQFRETEPIQFDGVLEKTLDNFRPQMKAKRIQLEKDIQGFPALQANRSLLEVLASNLLNNAIRHNLPAGLVRVTLTERELLVQNTGRSSGLDPRKIFRRFYKESTDPNSTGLGLQIIQQISVLYGWKASYEYREEMHTFGIEFGRR